MTGGASERLRWAVDSLDVAPTAKVLEVGCGHGVAVSLLCDRLVEGRVTALDRSATMVAAARRRNADHVASGRARILQAALADAGAELDDERFDAVLAVHVPVLQRGSPAAELAVLADHLVVGGRLSIVFQPLSPDEVEPTVARLEDVLAAGGFRVTGVRVEDLPGGRIAAVTATPALGEV